MTQVIKEHFDELSILVKMIDSLNDRLSFLKYDMKGIDYNSSIIVRREINKVKKRLSPYEKRYNELTDIIINTPYETNNRPQSPTSPQNSPRYD